MSLIMKIAILNCIEITYITALFIAYLNKPRLIDWEDKQISRCRRTSACLNGRRTQSSAGSRRKCWRGRKKNDNQRRNKGNVYAEPVQLGG